MALMIPHGRRGYVLRANAFDSSADPDQRVYCLGVQVALPRNIQVPPVYSRDYQWVYLEGVRTAQIMLQIPIFKGTNNNNTTHGFEDWILTWIFGRKADGDTYGLNLIVYDGHTARRFDNVKVQSASMAIAKGQPISWQLVCLAPNIGAEVTASNFPALPTTLVPVSWQDVKFLTGDSDAYTPPVYGVEFSVMNNHQMNAPIAEGTTNNGTGIARWDAGFMQASASITYATFKVSDFTTLFGANTELDFSIQISAGTGTVNRKFRMRRLIPENPLDLQSNFGPMFRTVRFIALGNPTAGGPEQFPITVT